jgi:hypothetical protein
VSKKDLDWGIDQLAAVLFELAQEK